MLRNTSRVGIFASINFLGIHFRHLALNWEIKFTVYNTKWAISLNLFFRYGHCNNNIIFFSQNNILENALILLPLSLFFLVILKFILVVISLLFYDLLNLPIARINSAKFAIHGSVAKIDFSKFSIFCHVNCTNLLSENLCFRKFMPIR